MQSGQSTNYFLYVAKKDETTLSILSKLPLDARKFGVILYPDPNSHSGSSSSGACQYMARIIMEGQEIADSVSIGDQLLPKEEFLTSENNKNYDKLICIAFTQADRFDDIPRPIRERLAREAYAHELQEVKEEAEKRRKQRTEEQRKKEEDAANDVAIFQLIASDPEPLKEETQLHPLEYKNPSLRKPLTMELNNAEATEEPIVPIDLINTMLVYDDFDPITGTHGSAPLVSTLFNSIKTQRYIRLKELLTAITEGNLDKVKEMCEKDPTLLLDELDENDYVIAPSGQKANNRKAYRTALAVEDTQMAAWIKNKLHELTGNDDIANTQYREQFPDGWETDEEKRWAGVFTTLDTLTTVIRDAKPGDITSSGDPEYKLTIREGSDVAVALALFRSQLDALLDEVVTTGRHFNPHLLLKAFQIYDDHYSDFGNYWNDPRAMLFWQQVIGTIQRRLPANYVQAFCDGLYTTEEKLRNDTPQGRSLKIELYDSQSRSWVATDFYPLSSSRLGFDYAMGASAALGAGAVGRGSGPWRAGFRSLCQSKTACMQTFAPQPQNTRRRSAFCSVM